MKGRRHFIPREKDATGPVQRLALFGAAADFGSMAAQYVTRHAGAWAEFCEWNDVEHPGRPPSFDRDEARRLLPVLDMIHTRAGTLATDGMPIARVEFVFSSQPPEGGTPDANRDDATPDHAAAPLDANGNGAADRRRPGDSGGPVGGGAAQ